MVRKTLIAGNWKMNCLLEDGVALAKGVAQEAKKAARKDCEFLICPPFTLLASAKKAIKGSRVMLGAQDCHLRRLERIPATSARLCLRTSDASM